MKNIIFLSEILQFWEVKFSIYLNRLVFVMGCVRLSETFAVTPKIQKIFLSVVAVCSGR